jgi:opine dehydrogenase
LWIHELVVQDAVLTDLAAGTKEEALKELVGALQDAGRLNRPEEAVRDLIARERAGGTGVGKGMAIPHACTGAVHQPMVAFGRSSAGIDFNAFDGSKANYIFLILNGTGGDTLQLRILARLAKLIRVKGLADNLRESFTKETLLDLLKGSERPFGEIESSKDLPNVCIAGAGSGGHAMAAHLALKGCKVNLFNRSEDRLATVKVLGGIHVYGEVNGYAKIDLITSDPAEALEDVDLVMVVVPATAHQNMARLLGPHLRDGQIVILNPGRTGGALEFAEALKRMNVKTFCYVGETQTLLYVCRLTNPGQVRIMGIKNAVPLATIPAYQLPDVLPIVKKVLQQFTPGDNVLKTSLGNTGALFHPTLAVLNAAWIAHSHGDFEFYHQGASPTVARVLEVLDKERLSIAAALGIRVPSAREWLFNAYGVAEDDLYHSMQAYKGYSGLKAPNRIDHRYVAEDVPYSLVPMASLADHLDVPVPTMNAIIHLASILTNRHFMSEGRTIERLGLADLDIRGIRKLVEEGIKE